jgi:hypothetical protein
MRPAGLVEMSRTVIIEDGRVWHELIEPVSVGGCIEPCPYETDRGSYGDRRLGTHQMRST